MKLDKTPQARILDLLLLLLQQPYRYTRKQLDERYEVDEQTTRRMIQVMKSAGISVELDSLYRYAVLPQGLGKELTRLQPLTDEERSRIKRILPSAFAKTNEAEVISRKLESLYDFQRLGLRALRSPELAKIDDLEAGIRNQRCVVLEEYRSTNSNVVSDRHVEAFHLDTGNGIIHAFEPSTMGIRHFRLDRLRRVQQTTEAWQHIGSHLILHTDPFRITTSNTVRCHMRLNVRAYNDLIERFPAAQVYTSETAKAEVYDFDGMVNADFLGILPFCMGNWDGIEVLEPVELKARIKKFAEKIWKS